MGIAGYCTPYLPGVDQDYLLVNPVAKITTIDRDDQASEILTFAEVKPLLHAATKYSLPNNEHVFADNFHPACRHVSSTSWFRLCRVGNSYRTARA